MFVDGQTPSAFIYPMGEERSNANYITSAIFAEIVGLLFNAVFNGSGIIGSHIARICAQKQDLLGTQITHNQVVNRVRMIWVQVASCMGVSKARYDVELGLVS